jgi:hypothetical protein
MRSIRTKKRTITISSKNETVNKNKKLFKFTFEQNPAIKQSVGLLKILSVVYNAQIDKKLN